MKRQIIYRCLGVVAFLASVLLVARLDVQATPQKDNKEVSKLLEDIKEQAAILQRDSDELEAYTRSNVSWQSHAEELDRIKERINAIGKTISRLQALRDSAAPWQREAIDRTLPVATKLASNTTAAIEHLNKNPQRIHDPEYQQYIKSNAEPPRISAALVKDLWSTERHGLRWTHTNVSWKCLDRGIGRPATYLGQRCAPIGRSVWPLEAQGFLGVGAGAD